MARREGAKGNLDLLLLGVLAEAPGHGYSVTIVLRERSKGAFELPEGTVYPALHRMEDAGLLSSDWQDVAGRRRRVYRLTSAGVRALAVKRARWAEFASTVEAIIGPVGVVPT